jgi:transcriptional regulator with XRE-family HTH domain
LPEQGTPVGGCRLAAELRRLRERAGLTGEAAAHHFGWSGSKLSRIELHRIGVEQADLRKLLALFGVDQGHSDDLLALARESGKKGRLERATAQLTEVAPYAYAEAEAASI